MESSADRAIAIVAAGAILPDATNVQTFWENIKNSRYSITEVPPDRWDAAKYYDPDHSAPDKTYSKIGGWVREFTWEPMKWRLPIPPRVSDQMDGTQKWAVACTREALEDYGYPKRALDPDRTAVILGNAMAGEQHYLTAFRVCFPEFAEELGNITSFAALSTAVRNEILAQLSALVGRRLPVITEDTLPGELANCIAGRIANAFNFRGPNYTCDAACASAMAAVRTAAQGLVARDFDAVITGGIDRNMGVSLFVKFCKIGALSESGSRPYADGADGFIMGEGGAIFVMKRLADAERDGDKIYAVLRGIAGSSDGKGKGITAPNPIGQKLAIQHAWESAGVAPEVGTLIEGHGTSTRVGDAVETESAVEVFKKFNLPVGSVAIGSVKSNIGHLKGGASAAGLLKATLALRDKLLPPSLNCQRKNPTIDWSQSPIYVNTELKPWDVPNGGVRRAGVSAFGFGGTNFHAVLEEYIPGRIKADGNGKHSVAVAGIPALTESAPANARPAASASTQSAAASAPAEAAAVAAPVQSAVASKPVETSPAQIGPAQIGPAQIGPAQIESAAPVEVPVKAPLRGALVIGAETAAALAERLQAVLQSAQAGQSPAPAAPAAADLHAPERLTIDYGNAAELTDKAQKALKALTANQPGIWKALRAQGIFRGQGPAPKVAFLFTGQGSQYVNMIKDLRAVDPVIADTFAEADKVLTPLLGKPLSKFIFVDSADEKAVAQAEDDLRQTAITQPAVIATDVAITRLLNSYGITPDMVMGHSVGEYGALVASGGLPFEDSLEAVSVRGREMTTLSLGDNGKMAAVFAPLPEIDRILKTIEGYAVTANINSSGQAVIGGYAKTIEEAIEAFLKAGYNAVPLSVSHAFHTKIVAAASEPLRRMLERLRLQSSKLPTVANINGEFYPMGPEVKPIMVDMLAQQVASPVQFVKGLETLYNAGARVFVETGPKKALQGFAEDVLGERGDVLSLFTNHPKLGDIVSFNQALCGLYAAGLGRAQGEAVQEAVAQQKRSPAREIQAVAVEATGTDGGAVSARAVSAPAEVAPAEAQAAATVPVAEAKPAATEARERSAAHVAPFVIRRSGKSASVPADSPVVVTGAALGLPGTERIFDDGNIARILAGEQFIKPIPMRFREAMVGKNITRLMKNENGGPTFEPITDVADVIKLAGRGGEFDLAKDFGVSAERMEALDRATCLAMAAGIDALRDAGIPLVQRYKTTTKGTKLPDRWMLPDALRDDTGIIFASAWPGYNRLYEDLEHYHTDRNRRQQLALLESLRAQVNGNAALAQEMDRQIQELRTELEKNPYQFDRRYIFRILAMGHSQFAEFIGARGPNTCVNAACASTAHAISMAEDWLRLGHCRRVVVLSADDVTTDALMEWMGSGFLVSGAAATGEKVEEVALPFDRRRNGMLLGMGASSLVLETAEAARERGIRPICEIMSSIKVNSAYHGTRLDVEHICQIMEKLMAEAENRNGIDRRALAPETVFVSHETYTPARGGSSAAEIHALRQTFGDVADSILIANTKGFTGHAMGTGIEDVVAVKCLETGVVPPVANFKEVDPELGELNLSKGGYHPVQYALRLGAGFGSQVAMTLYRRVGAKDEARPSPTALGYANRIADSSAWGEWLKKLSGAATAELEVVNRTLRIRDQARVRIAAAAEKAAAVAPAQEKASTAAAPVKAMAAAATATGSVVSESKAESRLEIPSVAPAAPSVASGDDSIKAKVLAVVSEKTGYPVDMLDVELDMEADLGIDTVKQAEVFAAIREAYGIARDDKIRLRDFPTLAHVIRFVQERSQAPVAAAVPAATEQAPATAAQAPASVTEPAQAAPAVFYVAGAPVAGDVKDRVLAIVADKTGYPQDMLDLDLDLEADLGVDTVKQAEIIATIREIYGIARDPNLKLRDYPTLGHVIRFIYDKCPDLAGATSTIPTSEPATPAPTPDAAATLVEAAAPAPIVETAPVSPAPAAVAAAPAVSDEEIKQKVLEIVAEKTGYPQDMLDLDLDLEADLGIDTVKQAEMFAAIRAAYNIPRDPNLKLRDFPTLTHVIQFARKGLNAAAAPAAVEASAAPVAIAEPVTAQPVAAAPAPEPVAAAPAVSDEEIKQKVLAIVAEKTGYPQDMLDLDLDLEADLGIDTVKQAEMFAAIRAAYNIPRDPNLKLRDFPTLTHVIQFARRGLNAAAAPAPVEAEASAVAAAAEPIAAQPVAAVPVTEVATAAPAVSDEEIKQKVLAIVAEKTGYPQDMLDLDLDLEADLGIDTVKQAEMFAAIRAAYSIPRDPNLKLRDFPTLTHVIQFARRGLSAAAAPGQVATPATSAPAKPAVTASVEAAAPAPKKAAVPRPPLASLDAANSIPRRVPVPSPRPPLAICKPTGVKLGPGSRVVLMPDQGGVGKALAEQLQALGVEVLLININDAPTAEALVDRLKSWKAAGPLQGVFWLSALDNEAPIGNLDLAGWHEAVRVRVKLLYHTMRTLYDQVAKPGTFLVSATRLGGQHGYDDAGSFAPVGGSVVGFTKTYKRERMEALVKAVDFEESRSAAQIAGLLMEEAQRDPGAVEVGYTGSQRWTVSLQELPAADGQPGMTLDENTVFVVTGAAGSIVSAITSDLAAASGGVFYLLDLVPKPDPANLDLKRFVTDKDGLKRELFARIQARGERATPAMVERELAGLERAVAANSAMEAVRKAGGTAHYYSVNLTDSAAVAKVIAELRERSGKIDVLLHAAGMERSHFLPDKEPREFDLIFDVKCDGWFNLLHAIGDMPIGATVAFSSVAGRFGNGGQADYSSANDLLCKFTSSFRTTRPSTRGIVIDWTAWGGIGMATRGSIPKMMEMAGIDMLPPEAGIPLIRRELTAGGTRGEIVIGQRLGILGQEWDETGGVDANAGESAAKCFLAAYGPMLGKVTRMGVFNGLQVETTLDPKVQPFLYDHQIDGIPVLPGVMGIEGFAEAAMCMVPGWQVATVEDVKFLAPFKFYRNEPRTVTLELRMRQTGDELVADCRLNGSRQLPNQAEPQVTTHFTGRVRLARQPAQPVNSPAPKPMNGSASHAEDIYKVYFHGPAYQVVDHAWRDGSRIIAQMPGSLPANNQPPERATVAGPRLIELCFQTAGLWELGVENRFGLPNYIEQVRLLGTPSEGADRFAIATPNFEKGTFNVEVMDASGKTYVQMFGYRTVELSSSFEPEPLKALRAAAAAD